MTFWNYEMFLRSNASILIEKNNYFIYIKIVKQSRVLCEFKSTLQANNDSWMIDQQWIMNDCSKKTNLKGTIANFNYELFHLFLLASDTKGYKYHDSKNTNLLSIIISSSIPWRHRYFGSWSKLVALQTATQLFLGYNSIILDILSSPTHRARRGQIHFSACVDLRFVGSRGI